MVWVAFKTKLDRVVVPNVPCGIHHNVLSLLMGQVNLTFRESCSRGCPFRTSPHSLGESFIYFVGLCPSRAALAKDQSPSC